MISVNNCLIINLDSRKDLWNNSEEFRKKWKSLNKKVHRIAGIHLGNNTHNLNNLIISNRIDINGGGFRNDKYSVISEFGCFLAHYKCWEYIYNNKLEACLILEDGINFLRNDYENLSIDPNLDILYVNKEMTKYNETIIQGYGLQGYIITLNGAKNLLDKCFKIVFPIDLQLRNYCNSKILNGNIISKPFVERDNNRLSSHGKNRKLNISNNVNDKQDQSSLIQRILTNLINKNINLDDLI